MVEITSKLNDKSKNEDVEVGVDNHNEHIQLCLEMERTSPECSFEYTCDIDDVGQIVFTPMDPCTRFVGVRRLAGYDSVEDIVTDTTRAFAVSIHADMLSESDNFDWFVDIDEVGQAVICPDSESTSFLSASVDNSLNLITEDADIDVASKIGICEELLKDIDTSMESMYKSIEALLKEVNELGIVVEGEELRYIEDLDKLVDKNTRSKFIDNMRKLVVENKSNSPTNESIMTNLQESVNHNSIIKRFMKGEIDIIPFEKMSEGQQYEEISALENTFEGQTFKYYYDKESDCLGVMIV